MPHVYWTLKTEPGVPRLVIHALTREDATCQVPSATTKCHHHRPSAKCRRRVPQSNAKRPAKRPAKCREQDSSASLRLRNRRAFAELSRSGSGQGSVGSAIFKWLFGFPAPMGGRACYKTANSVPTSFFIPYFFFFPQLSSTPHRLPVLTVFVPSQCGRPIAA